MYFVFLPRMHEFKETGGTFMAALLTGFGHEFKESVRR